MRESGTYEVQGLTAVAWQKLKHERARLDSEETALILHALENANGIVAIAARELGIARTTLASRLKVLGVRAGAVAIVVPSPTPQAAEQLSAAPAVRGAGAASRP